MHVERRIDISVLELYYLAVDVDLLSLLVVLST